MSSCLEKLEEDQFAQMLAVAAGHHEADQVVLVARGEGDHQQELGLFLAGQGGDHVGGA